jgi:CBS domain-containing protein
MTTLSARDLMTAEVARVPPDTPVTAIARLFADRGISAVSVTDAGGILLGIVTESDLIRRLADEDELQSEGWFERLLGDSPNRKAERYARSHGAKASEVMTAHVVTVGPEANAAHIAHLMDKHRIRRVLVAEDGQLLGIVSRSDLVRALLVPQQTFEGEISDERIRRAVVAAMQRESWADTLHTAVDVRNGVVEFYGFSRSETVSRALCVLAENVPGVKSVLDHTRHRAVMDPS